MISMYSHFENFSLPHMVFTCSLFGNSIHLPMRKQAMMMLRSTFCFLFCSIFLLFMLPTPIFAAYTPGEVLYHQDFTRVSTANLANIRAGSSNSPDAQIGVTDDGLVINPNSDRRTYAILPEIENTDTYTIELTFRFQKTYTTNGYFAFLLTCTGDKPSNVTAVVLRADGSIDDFGTLNNTFVQHFKNNDEIRLTIPVVDGVLHTLKLTCGTETETLERSSLLRIPDGYRGFCVRNASVLIEDTAILYGTDYEKPTGYFATHSYAEDDGARTDMLSPATGDRHQYLFAGMIVFAALSLYSIRMGALRRPH